MALEVHKHFLQSNMCVPGKEKFGSDINISRVRLKSESVKVEDKEQTKKTKRCWMQQRRRWWLAFRREEASIWVSLS